MNNGTAEKRAYSTARVGVPKFKILVGFLVGMIFLTGCSGIFGGENDDFEKENFEEVANDESADLKSVYRSEKYSFQAKILENYKVEYLEGDEGFIMRRSVVGEELKKIYDLEFENWPGSAKEGPDESSYQVIIGISAMKNLMEYEDLGAYIKSECADCSLEFSGNGVFVGEDKGSYSERVYLAMSDNKNILYRGFLRLPPHRFKYHQKWFDEWANSIEFF